MQYFIKATTERSEIIEHLLTKPLMFAVLFECSRRVRRISEDSRINGLKQGEFLISETEFKKFGLKKTQKNKLARVIKSLVDLKIIEKTGNKTGNAQCIVYRLIDLTIFMPHMENGELNGEVAGNGRGTVGERSGTKEECKNEKNEKNEKENTPPPADLDFQNPISSPLPEEGEGGGEQKKKVPPKKKRYGEYNNVLLADDELEKLKEKFPDYKNKIEEMDKGEEMKGYKYKSHYLAILKWAKNDKQPATKILQFSER